MDSLKNRYYHRSRISERVFRRLLKAFAMDLTATDDVVQIPVSVPAGANVWLTAQWFNPRMETGPGCTAVLTSVTNAGDQRLAA